MGDYNSKVLINYEFVESLHKSKTWGNLVLKMKHKDKMFALKCFPNIDSGLTKTIFYREMEALKELNACEGIVKLRQIDTELYPFGDQREPYGGILMDFVPGKTLDEIDWCKIPQLTKFEICKEILTAVNNAHAHSVIHRDIKPSNIIFNEDSGKITIIDFGTSKIKSIVNDSETTMPFFSKGYSAPELIMGTGVTEKSDYYSVGIVLCELLMGIEPSVHYEMVQSINSWTSGKKEIKDTLVELISQNPDDRPEDLSKAIELFECLTFELNTASNEFIVFVSQDQLQKLKNKTVVEQSMNMSQFTNSFLRRQFTKSYGFIKASGEYVITGKEIVIECSYENNTHKIIASSIGEITSDRRNINIKRSFEIPGNISFAINSSQNYDVKDNSKLEVIFKNASTENEQYKVQEENFERLFAKWEQGLQESVETERKKAAELKYTQNFEITPDQLIIEVNDIYNKTIDEIPEQTGFVVVGKDRKHETFNEIGALTDTIVEEDAIRMVFSKPKTGLKSCVKSLLKQNATVCEDYNSRIVGYTRQFKAINCLRKDDYSARGLKDIILCLEEPEEIPTIRQLTFLSEELNETQRRAVQKALNTETICLIQGPPGTGKTSVIKEIIGQIIKREIKTSDSPRILIVSQSHTAVDNILEGLSHIIDDQTEVIRIGADNKISKEISGKYTVSAHQKNLTKEIVCNVEDYIKTKESLMESVQDIQEQNRWRKIRNIQSDWLDRLSDFRSLDYQLIQSAVVVAGTCIGFLSNPIVKDMFFDYVIIDEAAKATTPELLVSIIKARKIVLVGDQNQLPAYADFMTSPTIAELTKNPDYRLFDILYNTLPDSHKQILTTQYRMIENIGNLISQVFYGGKINTGCNDEDRQHGLSLFADKSIVWLDTSNNPNKHQKRTKGNSFFNEEEKRIIVDFLQKLRNQNELDGLDIGIITGYNGQKELLRKSVGSNGFDRVASIDINTLDAFQGRENDIIIYSTVRTRDSIGFQKEKERVNVAFSRAKKLLIICGDLDFFYGYDDPDNKFVPIVDYIRDHDKQCSIVDCRGGKCFD